VVFWHFKTEATSQGEELYITMNARGEELADNEVTKAALMIGGSEIYEWGKKWEEWQQFFWKNRDKTAQNPSADKGFNGFLSCIAGLEYYLKDKQHIAAEKDIQKLLTIEKVQEYYNAFELLIDRRSEFQSNYNYSGWVQKCLTEIWYIFNKNETDWFTDYLDKNKSTERNRMVFLWSWLYYVTELLRQGREIQIDELYRLLRFFYVRFKNNNRSVSTLMKTIDLIHINGIWDILENEMGEDIEYSEEETDKKFRTEEETFKNKYFENKRLDPDVKKLEEIIWQIEDHPLNLDGSDVGNINLTHLVELNESTSIQKLTEVRDAFFTLFPESSKSGSAILKTILLHYGDFWKDTSYYHKRYDFSDWKRNIRKGEFKLMINELICKTPEILLNDLQAKFLSIHKEEINQSIISLNPGYSLRAKLIFYSILIKPKAMWAEGDKIIICDEVKTSRLFKDENKIIYNSKGNFKGDSGNSDLWKKACQKDKKPLDELKSK
jgi:hypothetical protein